VVYLTTVTTRGEKALMMVEKDFIVSDDDACYD
jgi:hypothetical protein